MHHTTVRAIAQTEVKRALTILKSKLDLKFNQTSGLESKISLLATSVAITETINKIGKQDETGK
jgi:hypothetical protein